MMRVRFGKKAYDFRPWRVADGAVFTRAFAFDCETTLIDEERPWVTPAYVLGAAFDGEAGYFVRRDRVAEFFAAHGGLPIVLHHATFDLAVIQRLAPQLDIYQRVERDHVWDTQILHRLYVLGSKGHNASGKGESTLEHCAETYLGIILPKGIVDSSGVPVRLSYGRWLNRPPEEIEPAYLEYLGADVVATWRVYRRLGRLLRELLDTSDRAWGYVSPKWLAEQDRRWGPQTHHIQLRASIVLTAITANGLTLDLARKQELTAQLEATVRCKRQELRRHGYLPGEKGSGKALQGILRRLEWEHREVHFPRTATGKYATSREALGELAGTVPFLATLFQHNEVEKLLNSFLDKMGRRVLHPSFNVLARSGRTSSFGEINAQNLPRDDRVRGCFVPSAGHVFLKADYATIEMATLAQALIGQFGLESRMARAINAGKDLHRLVAARVTGMPEEKVSDDDRQKAKPINFGKPGGMGNATLRLYARASYGVELDDAEVEELSEAWFALFPEMKEFLKKEIDLGEEVARLFDLTPATHYEHTGSGKFFNHPANDDRQSRPHPILGWMLLKVLKAAEPQTQAGEPYTDADVDYFWSQAEARRAIFPSNLQARVLNRQPSVALQHAVFSQIGRGPVFTLTGRLRANATFSARHNTVFQGLAADGAKLALWRLWRAGYRIVNFVHDEVLVEVPESAGLKLNADRIRRLMIKGMKAVVPDVRVDVEYAACDRWFKKAKPVLDRTGKLKLWRPSPKGTKRRASASGRRNP